MNKYILLIFVALGTVGVAAAQENSPLSRYGMGDLIPNQNISSRAMGGITAAMADTTFARSGANPHMANNTGSINTNNPASFGNLNYTIFDLGGEIDVRTIKSTNPAKRFTSVNTLFSYLQMGFPIASAKMKRKGMAWGMALGLKPITRVSYKIEQNSRLTNIDSLNTLYEGDGGINQAFIGTGYKYKRFSIGINTGYNFGSKSYNTRLTFINDTTNYYRSNTGNKTTFGGVFLNAGVQYDIPLKSKALLRLGAYGTLQQNFKANRNDVVETFYTDDNGANYRIDSVYEKNDISGTIKMPATFGGGFTYQNNNWLFGADFETTNWNSYRYYNSSDNVQNNWTIRGGAQYFPAKPGMSVRKYFNFVKYRAGFYYGTDYINLNGSKPQYGFTLGTGMPLTALSRYNLDGNSGDVVLNTALEFASRGSKTTNLRENIVRFSIGVSMSASWFRKIKYN
jgi:hypothetical protein